MEVTNSHIKAKCSKIEVTADKRVISLTDLSTGRSIEVNSEKLLGGSILEVGKVFNVRNMPGGMFFVEGYA